MKMINRTLTLVTVLLAAGTLITGCATRIKPAEESNERVEAARQAFGPGFEYMIVGAAGSSLADRLFVGFYRTGAASDLARELASRLAPAERKYLRFMVTGENDEKTAQVIVEALQFHVKGGLPNLELLYLGDQGFVPQIRQAVERVNGTLRSAPYPA